MASLVAAAIILAVILLPRMFNRKSETNRAAITPAQSISPVATGTKTVLATDDRHARCSETICRGAQTEKKYCGA